MAAQPSYAPAPTYAATQPSTTPAVVSQANGYVPGIDGMLSQVSGALVQQAKTQILPVLQQDRELQRTIGKAAGREIAKPLWVIAGVAAIYVGWRVFHVEE